MKSATNKPTEVHSYFLHSSSHPNHVKNSIPFSQFLRLRRLCSDELNFSNKSEKMLQFFKNRGYPDSVVKTAQERTQTTDRQSTPQTSQKEENQRIPFTLTFHPLNLLVKNIILKNFKLLKSDNETSTIFSLPPLISFKRNRNINAFLVRYTLKSDESPGTFNCTHKRCKTWPFIHNTDNVTGSKRSIKLTDRFTCISANVIYCIKCPLCKKIYIGETGRRIGDFFREHLRDVRM